MNRRRESELQKLSRDLEEAQTQNEAQLMTFRKKHQEAVNQLTEQMDQLLKVKQKYSSCGFSGLSGNLSQNFPTRTLSLTLHICPYKNLLLA